MRERKYVRNSLRNISIALKRKGYQSNPNTVARLLKEGRYLLQANRKCLTGPAHPDQELQLRYIRRVKKLFIRAGHPIISVDGKKKELIGNFKNPGRSWRKSKQQVNKYDFRNQAVGRAAPYGIYDQTHNWGCVVVGSSYETSEFAVDAISLWWQLKERPAFADESKLLILADGGGSNGYRPRLWKLQIQTELANRFGIQVMVCHYPPGASKYNPTRRCLFSPISVNWAGNPLVSFDTILGYIRNTSNKTGLVVKAFLLDREYKTGKKVSDSQINALNLIRRPICPNWNYIIKPC